MSEFQAKRGESLDDHSSEPHGIVGASVALLNLVTAIESVAPFACTVLIRGESGTGKELVAQAVHQKSARAAAPFVAVDCSTLRDTLLESQLFGHVRGAFTGADRENIGFFRSAEGGTLFLDEIGELPLAAQAKLLRCIQERCVIPLGGSKAIPVDVRIVAATHRNLREMVAAGTFREDLYFRIRVVQIDTPPLRERGDDILLLAQHFLDQLSGLYGSTKCRLGQATRAAVIAHTWPGNVRELANAMERAFVFRGATDEIGPECLPEEIRDLVMDRRPQAFPGQGTTTGSATIVGAVEYARPEPAAMVAATAEVATANTDAAAAESDMVGFVGAGGEHVTWAEMERRAIRAALVRAAGNISMAARTLDIERRRLTRKIDEYDLRSLTA